MVLYLRLLKVLLGFMYPELICYDLYATTLKSKWFIFNPYDRCIANSNIDSNHCTIAWYGDDNKILHID